jgi:Coenzyme PQQ synthesis protein D (PqqD)
VSKPAPSDMALHPNSDVIAKRLDQTSVLVHIPTNRIFELNETGSRVWEMIGESLNADQIVQRLADEFDVEEAQAANEVNELVTRLRDEGLLSS